MKKEIFRTFKHNNNYKISSHGRVFSIKSNRFLKPYKTRESNRNYCVRILDTTYTLYKLVQSHFKKCEYDSSGIHLDCNRKNNSTKNLKPTSRSEMLQWYKRKESANRWVFANPFFAKGKSKNPYRAVLNVFKTQVHVGYFKTKKEAKLAAMQRFKELYPNIKKEVGNA